MLLYSILSTGLLYTFWYFTQTFLQHDTHNERNNGVIVDRIHNLPIFIMAHNYLLKNEHIAKFMIMFTTLLIDINSVYFFANFILYHDIKPIALLIMGVVLRQMCQYMNRLPSPDNVIWFNPGFPSIIMHYDVADDFFFSGHTLISLIFGIELFNSTNMFIKLYSVFYMAIEILFILTSKAHYFMDVYGAISTYFMIVYFYNYYFV
jgi:hypothetical protein